MITITITPSEEQIVYGIPKNVVITTNIPAIIFYTLDQTDPSPDNGMIYVDTLDLPTYLPSIHLKLFATDGNDSSEIVYQKYFADMSKNKNVMPFVTSNLAPGCGGALPPSFYTTTYVPPQSSLDDQNIPKFGDGYGANGEFPMRTYDEEIPMFNLQYSETNWKGEVGKDIGTLPARPEIVYTPPPPIYDNANKKTYNPKALVIFHDGTKPTENSDLIFRPFFCGEDLEKDFNGSGYGATTHDSSSHPSGSFVNYHYNPRDNTINFYYYDNRCNRWIISKEPVKFESKSVNPDDYNILSPNVGDRFVYRWKLFGTR